MHEKCTHVTYKFLSSGWSPFVALTQDNALLLSFPESYKGSCLNIYHEMFQRRELTVAQWCHLSFHVSFRDPWNTCRFGWGHPTAPLLDYLAHIHAKYLTNDFFLYVLILHKFGSANPKLWQRPNMLGTGFLTAASRRNGARGKLACFLLLLPTVFHVYSLQFNSQIDLFLSRDGVDAIGLWEKEEDRKTSWNRNV